MQLSFRGVSWSIIFEPLTRASARATYAMGIAQVEMAGRADALVLSPHDTLAFRLGQQGYAD